MAFDSYELLKWQKIKESRARICQGFVELDAVLDDKHLQSDAWGAAYAVIHRMVNDLNMLEKTVLVVRCRKMEEKEFGKRPKERA